MRLSKLLPLLFLALLNYNAANAGYIINEFAADLDSASYSASSTYLNNSYHQAENAFNGGGANGYWNSGNYGWAWIQADMGITQTLTELKLTIIQSPNGVTSNKIYLSDTYISDYSLLTPIYERTGFTGSATGVSVIDITLDQDYSGQFLLILSHGGPSWTALGDPTTARINWNQTPSQSTTSNPNNVPEPSIFALMGLGFLA